MHASPSRPDRRQFLKYCATIAATLGLEASWVPRIADALTSGQRPPVVWLHFSECTGCSEAFLRHSNPDVASIILETIDLAYHETLMVAAGDKAEHTLDHCVTTYPGEFICIVEGAVPTANGGLFGMIGNETMLSIAQRVLPAAKYIVAFGTCSAYGGLPAAAPNPTGAKGMRSLASGHGISVRNPTINIPGCPPNPINLMSCLTSYLLNGTMPSLDSNGRPSFAFGKTVHSQCTKPYGCIQGYNCKGPSSYNNCPNLRYNDGQSWCVQVEHQCIGCATPNFWDVNKPFYNAMWANMFGTYRNRATNHRGIRTATCTGSNCHSSSTYNSNSISMHSKHDIVLSGNSGCGNCHTAAPGTNKNPIHD